MGAHPQACACQLSLRDLSRSPRRCRMWDPERSHHRWAVCSPLSAPAHLFQKYSFHEQESWTKEIRECVWGKAGPTTVDLLSGVWELEDSSRQAARERVTDHKVLCDAIQYISGMTPGHAGQPALPPARRIYLLSLSWYLLSQAHSGSSWERWVGDEGLEASKAGEPWMPTGRGQGAACMCCGLSSSSF